MKKTLAFILLTISFTNCSKDCSVTPDACSEIVPTNELCAMDHERWFYNAEKNRCSKIGYSGCSRKGFDTKKACEACKCN